MAKNGYPVAKNGHPVAKNGHSSGCLAGGASTGTGWPGVCIKLPGEIASSVNNLCLSVEARTTFLLCLVSLASCWDVKGAASHISASFSDDQTLFLQDHDHWNIILTGLNTRLLLLVACLTSQQQARVSQGRICLDNFTCCHTEIEVADPTFYLTQSQYTDSGPTSPSADPITPGAWQGSHWSANFEVTGMTRPRKNPDASGIRTRDLPLSRRTP